jgi:hypothetical protein
MSAALAEPAEINRAKRRPMINKRKGRGRGEFLPIMSSITPSGM